MGGWHPIFFAGAVNECVRAGCAQGVGKAVCSVLAVQYLLHQVLCCGFCVVPVVLVVYQCCISIHQVWLPVGVHVFPPALLLFWCHVSPQAKACPDLWCATYRHLRHHDMYRLLRSKCLCGVGLGRHMWRSG